MENRNGYEYRFHSSDNNGKRNMAILVRFSINFCFCPIIHLIEMFFIILLAILYVQWHSNAGVWQHLAMQVTGGFVRQELQGHKWRWKAMVRKFKIFNYTKLFNVWCWSLANSCYGNKKNFKYGNVCFKKISWKI